MRILIMHRSFALVGGAERVIIDKANYLSDMGHEVILIIHTNKVLIQSLSVKCFCSCARLGL